MLNRRVASIALLLMGSGLCSLVYQVAWLRELRLVFGASTAASAAVLAIFMGGLGLGGIALGRHVDRHKNPLAFYATLELVIALCAAASPFLLLAVRSVYISLGGSMAMGLQGATVVRLLLSSLVLGLPTFLMGGTLPAVARAASTREDVGRNHVAILYGMNTLGAVVGALLATFFLLEMFGTRSTIWLACLLNLIVVVSARALARNSQPDDASIPDEAPSSTPETSDEETDALPTPVWFVLLAAAVVGFSFLLMELVWYRMLSPLLGGSTYTFGLILAVALLGIGTGSVAYALIGRRNSPTLEGFALTVGLEALFMAIPLGLGDRIAIFAEALHELSALGFYGQVTGWAIIACIVVLPAAFISGYQFPLLIGLLGQGRANIGRHTGLAYGFNTGGAILGSLAGGFGALPILGAVGAWKSVVVVLALLGVASLVVSSWKPKPEGSFLFPVATIWCAVFLVFLSVGPTAVWRHSSIGAGRSRLDLSTQNDLIRTMEAIRRNTRWEKDGLESSVAIQVTSSISFLINGKNDGNARYDASTQVMLALISAILHPAPERSFVIGMGTGSTAGWLGAIESMEQVDVAELEPAVMEIVRQSNAVNHHVLDDEKVNVIAGDARELLLTAPEKYDLIVSEPSNPYRAGLASLYTVEFYEAASARLREGGYFSQWVQAYEIDSQTFRTIYATAASVFENVETWQSNDLDLVLVCSNEEISYSVEDLRTALQTEPYSSALRNAWNVVDIEGFFSRYVANASFPKYIATLPNVPLNTDDRTLVEYGFARTVGQELVFSPAELRLAAYDHDAIRPLRMEGEVDWAEVEEQRMHMSALMNHELPDRETFAPGARLRADAMASFIEGDLDAVLSAWQGQTREPLYPFELVMIGEACAEAGDERALAFAAQLESHSALEAEAIRARYLFRTGEHEQALEMLERLYIAMRDDPWPNPKVMDRALRLAQEVAMVKDAYAERLLLAIDKPFSTWMHEELRMEMAVEFASRVGSLEAAKFIEAFEPNALWTREFLAYRALCYEESAHPQAKAAKKDLLRFLKNDTKRFNEVIQNQAGPAGQAVAREN